MQDINFYIAYLLTKHECVAIQGFGAFVVSKMERKRRREETFLCPPFYLLGFNPAIKHNDGLLVNTIAKGRKISYQESYLQIHQYVDFLNKQLIEQKKVQIPWVGSLSLSTERKIVFTPSIQPSCNAVYFGLTNFYMPTLKELEDSIELPILKSNKETEVVLIPLNRRMIHWTGSIAAAVLALFLVATPLNRHPSVNSQQAAFIPVSYKTWKTPAKEVEEIKELEILADEIAVGEQPIEQSVPIVEIQQEELIQEPVAQPTQYYYIIIASLPTRNSAEEMMKNFQRNEFPEADVISTGDKHRVYMNKFENKAEAEMFLNVFRNNYPKHSSAWMLSQKS